jgi:hypothetical protein
VPEPTVTLVVGFDVVPHLKPLEVTVASLALVTFPLKYPEVDVWL